jgi:hypothetical protein
MSDGVECALVACATPAIEQATAWEFHAIIPRNIKKYNR